MIGYEITTIWVVGIVLFVLGIGLVARELVLDARRLATLPRPRPPMSGIKAMNAGAHG